MKFVLFIIAICFSVTLSAQNFFKPIKKFTPATLQSRGLIAEAETGDITFFALRPIAAAVSLYIEGDVQAAAGGGLSYQNITQRASDSRSYVNYSINLIIAAGGGVSENATPSNIGKAAFYVAALNNTVGLGYGVSRQQDPVTLKKAWKGGLALVWTYNFNN